MTLETTMSDDIPGFYDPADLPAVCNCENNEDYCPACQAELEPIDEQHVTLRSPLIGIHKLAETFEEMT